LHVLLNQEASFQLELDDELLLNLAEAPLNIPKNKANLKEVNHEISEATKPCSTAPGNNSGIVHAHNNFIIKKAIAINPTTKAIIPGIIANNFVLFILKLLY